MTKHKYIFILLFTLISCTSMKNLDKPKAPYDNEGYFFTTKTGCKLFVYDFQPIENYNKTIFIIAGITGINHNAEKDIIEQLSNKQNRVVVIHPRGTGYSDGTRGDISDFSHFINDYVELIKQDKDYSSNQHKMVLYGHSMSAAVLLAVADKIENISGAILVNPPYVLKKAKGMSPSFTQYVKYAWFYMFAQHSPIVNMAGDPAKIENEKDRAESEQRVNDPLLVKYFSMYMMNESRKVMNSMLEYAKTASYPLLIIYGDNDNIVDKKGCDLIFDSWKCENKQYVLLKGGSHGKSTVILAKDTIDKWVGEL